MISGVELIEKCRGRWRDILMRFDVPEESLDGKHHGCPVCGEGRNSHRFRFDDKNGEGTWICTQCGAGYGLQLIEKIFQCTTAQAMERLDRIVDDIPAANMSYLPKNEIDPRPALNKLWLLSERLTGGDFVSRYLHSRGLTLMPHNVRYNTACYEPDSKARLLAMVARIINADNKPIGLHRTYLNGLVKADIPAPKKLMPATEPLRGSAIRLFSSQDRLFKSGVLGIAEGIETAMAATHLFNIATWACINSKLMSSWLPPRQIREIVIFGDNDANMDGQQAAYSLAKRLYSEGFIVGVRVPTKPGNDFADVWLGHRKQQEEK